MSLRDFARRVIAGPTAEYRAGLANPSYEMADSFGVTASYSGEKVTIQTAMGLGSVRSAVKMVSEAVGGLPLKVYRIMENDERVEARTHRSWMLLHDKPNEHCNARTFWTATAAQLLVYENSFIYKERDLFTGLVDALYHLDPKQVRVEIAEGRKLYIIEGPPRKVYTDEDVLHIVGFSLDGYYGSSRLTTADQTIGAAIARAKFEGGFYKSGGKFPGTLQHPGRLSKEGAKKLKDSWETNHSGVDRMHRTPILEEGMTFSPSGQSMEQMQFAELAEQTRREIATLFNIPAAFLNASSGDSLTYATTESNQIQFAQNAVLPIADTIAKAISADAGLLPWNVMYCEFVLESLLRANMEARANYYKIMQPLLRLTPEYIASRENIPRDAIGPEPKPIAPPAPPQDQQDQADNGAAPVRLVNP